jgi:hypothetical protein
MNKENSMLRITKVGLAASAATALLACSSPTDPSSTSATVSLSATPDPANAETSRGVFYILQGDANNADQTLEYPFQASFTVTITESGGEALDVTSISLRIQQATGGIITPPTNGQVEHYQFVSSASGKTLPARGTLGIGFQAWYALPNLRRECVATISLTFVDKKGTPDDTSDDVALSKSFDVQIQ